MEVSGQFHAPAAVPPGKELLVPIGCVGLKTNSIAVFKGELLFMRALFFKARG
jgi:hypothetical protein